MPRVLLIRTPEIKIELASFIVSQHFHWSNQTNYPVLLGALNLVSLHFLMLCIKNHGVSLKIQLMLI